MILKPEQVSKVKRRLREVGAEHVCISNKCFVRNCYDCSHENNFCTRHAASEKKRNPKNAVLKGNVANRLTNDFYTVHEDAHDKFATLRKLLMKELLDWQRRLSICVDLNSRRHGSALFLEKILFYRDPSQNVSTRLVLIYHRFVHSIKNMIFYTYSFEKRRLVNFSRAQTIDIADGDHSLDLIIKCSLYSLRRYKRVAEYMRLISVISRFAFEGLYHLIPSTHLDNKELFFIRKTAERLLPKGAHPGMLPRSGFPPSTFLQPEMVHSQSSVTSSVPFSKLQWFRWLQAFCKSF